MEIPVLLAGPEWNAGTQELKNNFMITINILPEIACLSDGTERYCACSSHEPTGDANEPDPSNNRPDHRNDRKKTL
ncbi:hypothetical protein NTGZN8_250005 [Candidatus Nitrotoga fabula]|uniref:Uncharacterized protein n=1 Tax=Candidatus Nitrotoga fabula TaxID=2182327 RepID=A0A916F8Y5_9PROT|nr:hypothetical protein NTGZN8_250005 [Candidatus Nitrotoga fabula]